MHQYRTHTCGELRRHHFGKQVRLSGWLRNRRDHGGITFIDLADHYGVTQLVVSSEAAGIYEEVTSLPKETVIRIDGTVRERSDQTRNSEMATGDIEVGVTDLEVLGPTGALPFPVFPDVPTSEDLRLTYRFLDLRRSKMHRNIVLRSRIIASIRQRMVALGFTEYQTPTLTASSPEGARDYLVPARRHPGQFYALPQAPQMFKQLIMISGFDRYFQIAPCYRDEDARADRSPGEFYQLDLEMSFATQEDVFKVIETLFYGLFQEFAPSWAIDAPPFPRITYDDAILRYGTDKPDLRNPLLISDLSNLFVTSNFKVFAGRTVRGIRVPGAAAQSRSFFDRLGEHARLERPNGLTWATVTGPSELKGPPIKHLSTTEIVGVIRATNACEGDAIVFLAGDEPQGIAKALGALRTEVAERLGLINQNCYAFCWIVDFPMYERNPDTGAVDFSHNPFSMPQGGLEALTQKSPLEIKAFQYDIVCNGYELSSGAIRNHHPEIMYRAFEIAGYGRSEVDTKFKALINALKYGAPPHGGIAPGIDRIVMLLADEINIREVIMFPMNQNAEDLMMNAPSTVRPEQLRELHIDIDLRDQSKN